MTSADVANVPSADRVSENPVVLDAAAVDPTWPVIAVVPVVVAPFWVKIV